MFNIGWPELLLIAGVALMVFGPRRLADVAKSMPDVAKSLGQSVKSFKKGLKEGMDDKPGAGDPDHEPK
jgi:sec-independent protein translocase protein TatA